MNIHRPGPSAEELPKLFVGSAYESRDMVKAIQLNLGDDVNIVPWEQVFNSGAHVLDRLLTAASETPFGLFIFSPVIEIKNISEPDKVYRGPRDNVILEAGIFFGQYGKSHTSATPSRCHDLLLGSVAH